MPSMAKPKPWGSPNGMLLMLWKSAKSSIHLTKIYIRKDISNWLLYGVLCSRDKTLIIKAFMADKAPNDFDTSVEEIGKKLRELRIAAGYKSYEVLRGRTVWVVFNTGKWSVEPIARLKAFIKSYKFTKWVMLIFFPPLRIMMHCSSEDPCNFFSYPFG